MKTIFLTSSLENNIKTENGRIATKCDNSNFFIDRLRNRISKIKCLVFFASSPDYFEINDSYAGITRDSLNLDGFGIENLIVVDNRFKGDLNKTVMQADVVYLAGGHVPSQMKYFEKIGLKEILNKYNGVVIGQSAGSMNCAELVYAPPEEPEDLKPGYKKSFPGLGLTTIRIMPHMEELIHDDVDGHGKSSYEFCIEDSFDLPVYGIYDNGFVEITNGVARSYGKTLLIKDGTCKVLCDDKQNIEIADDYEIDVSTEK